MFGLPYPDRPRTYWVYYIIKNPYDFDSTLLRHHLAQTMPVVLMFQANWNEPSRVMLGPFRETALTNKKQAIFCRLDVDNVKDIAERYRVEALPTFVVIKEGKEKRRVVGAKVDELDNILKDI